MSWSWIHQESFLKEQVLAVTQRGEVYEEAERKLLGESPDKESHT